MTNPVPETTLTMVSLVKDNGELEISLARLPTKVPRDDEVVVKMLAAPINPSDLFYLLGPADMTSAKAERRNGLPVVTMSIAEADMASLAGRVGQAMAIGDEAMGIVVAAGRSAQAQKLLGSTVAVLESGMYTEYRCLPALSCMELPTGTNPRDGASCFVNPLTALSMIETMKRDGHTALIHTAAASNLGQMVNRLCLSDDIPLVNIVRTAAQAALLKAQGAKHVLNSTVPDFQVQLIQAIAETGAAVAFDAIGGGSLGGQILGAMEAAAARKAGVFQSDLFKQLYIYGALDRSPTLVNRNFGLKWSISGWLVFDIMAEMGEDKVQRMRDRIVAELTTTFASRYSHEITMEQALDPRMIAAYGAKRTGEKYLIRPVGVA